MWIDGVRAVIWQTAGTPRPNPWVQPILMNTFLHTFCRRYEFDLGSAAISRLSVVIRPVDLVLCSMCVQQPLILTRHSLEDFHVYQFDRWFVAWFEIGVRRSGRR